MVGQEHIGRTLGNAIRQGRVHHAYLFAGARGLGKTTTARIFAKGLVCEQGPTAEPCNACTQCTAVNEGRSVDVLEIDGASNNSVENIRSLREQVHYLPQSARRRVYIIDEVHMLTTSAFNALLKTLEEPPAHVNFIFATTEPQRVLPTILSRVSRLDFRRVSVEEAVAHLRSILEDERLQVDEGGLRLIARASGGSIRDSLTLLDQVIAFARDPSAVTEAETREVLGQADRHAVIELVAAVLERDPDAVIARLDALVGGGLDLMVLSLQILEHLRDLMLASVCRERAALGSLTDSEYEELRTAAGAAEPAVFAQCFDRFSRVVDRLPTSRVQRLLVEMALLDLANSEPVTPLGDLVEQLQALAQGGPGPAPSPGSTGQPGGSGRAPARGARTASATAGGGGDVADPRASAPSSELPGRPSAAIPEVSGRPFVEPTRLSLDETPRPPLRTATAPPSSGTAHSSPPSSGTARSAPPPSGTARSAPPPFAPARAQSHGRSPSSDAQPPVGATTEAPAHTASPEARPREAAGSGSGASGRSPLVAPRPEAASLPSPSSRPETDAAPNENSADDASSPFAAGLWALAKGTVFSGEGPEEALGPAASAPDAVPTVAAGSCPSGCAESEPPVGIIDVDTLAQFDAWAALVDRIRDEDEYVSAVLSEVGLVRLEGGVLRICAGLRSFAHNELQQRPEIRGQLEQATRDHFGRPFNVELEEGEAALPERPSIVLVAAQRREAHRRAVETEASQHTGIRSLLQAFNAKLTGTKPLHEPPA